MNIKNRILIILIIKIINFNLLAVSQRAMFIAYESKKSENITISLNKDFAMGIGAITGTTLIALYQEAAPVLISKYIWNNIVKHKILFENFCSKDYNFLFEHYKVFEKFKDLKSVQDFKSECIYANRFYESIKDLANSNYITKDVFYNWISNNNIFDRAYAPLRFQSRNLHAVTELSLYLLCSHILDRKYIFKDLGGAYLIIPISYMKKIIPNYEHINNISNYSENNYSKSEKILGLKIDHFNDVQDPYSVNIDYEDDDRKYYEKAIYDIFITDPQVTKSLHWVFYLIGHGNFSQDLEDVIDIEKTKINELLQKKCKLQNLLNSNNGYDINSIMYAMNNIDNSIKLIKNNIRKTKNLVCMVGLEKSRLRRILLYLNSNIITEFLCYDSCSCGGKNSHDLFLFKGKPIILSYPVIALSVTEAPTYSVGLPYFYITYYKDNNTIYMNRIEDIIDFQKLTMNLISEINLYKFFNQNYINYNFNNNCSFLNYLISASIINGNKMDKRYLCCIPTIRHANSYHFIIYSNIAHITINNSNKNTQITSNLDSIFINAKNINYINIQRNNSNQHFPALISTIPGKAIHKISLIDAHNFYLSEILNSFFPFKIQSAKIFIINKLVCKDDLINKGNNIREFHNVVLFHNCLPKDFSQNFNERLDGIFITESNITYSALWKSKENSLEVVNTKGLRFEGNRYNINQFLSYFK